MIELNRTLTEREVKDYLKTTVGIIDYCNERKIHCLYMSCYNINHYYFTKYQKDINRKRRELLCCNDEIILTVEQIF